MVTWKWWRNVFLSFPVYKLHRLLPRAILCQCLKTQVANVSLASMSSLQSMSKVKILSFRKTYNGLVICCCYLSFHYLCSFWNCEETISNFVPAFVICFKSTFHSTKVHPQLKQLLLMSETDKVEEKSDRLQTSGLLWRETIFFLICIRFLSILVKFCADPVVFKWRRRGKLNENEEEKQK